MADVDTAAGILAPYSTEFIVAEKTINGEAKKTIRARMETLIMEKALFLLDMMQTSIECNGIPLRTFKISNVRNKRNGKRVG